MDSLFLSYIYARPMSSLSHQSAHHHPYSSLIHSSMGSRNIKLLASFWCNCKKFQDVLKITPDEQDDKSARTVTHIISFDWTIILTILNKWMFHLTSLLINKYYVSLWCNCNVPYSIKIWRRKNMVWYKDVAPTFAHGTVWPNKIPNWTSEFTKHIVFLSFNWFAHQNGFLRVQFCSAAGVEHAKALISVFFSRRVRCSFVVEPINLQAKKEKEESDECFTNNLFS